MPSTVFPARQRVLRKRRRVWYALLAFLVFAGIAYGALFSGLMRVRSITVRGFPEQYRAPIGQAMADALRAPFWYVIPGDQGVLAALLRADAVCAGLQNEFPEIASLEARYHWLSRTLDVSGALRIPVGTVCDRQGACRLFDMSGKIFPIAAVQTPESDTLFAVECALEEQCAGSNLRASAAAFMTEFFKLSRSTVPVDSFVMEQGYFQAGTIKAKTASGWYMLLDEHTRPYVVVQNLKLLLSRELEGKTGRLEYIDARFEDRAYYKLR